MLLLSVLNEGETVRMHFVAYDSILPCRLAYVLTAGIDDIVPDRRRPYSRRDSSLGYAYGQMQKTILRLLNWLHHQFGEPRRMDEIVEHEGCVVSTTKPG